MQLLNTQTELKRLEWALQTADAPALFIAWQDNLETGTALNNSCALAGNPPELIAPNGLPWPEQLERKASEPNAGRIFILRGCLSSLDTLQRRRVNLEKGWLLSLDRKLIFVEPVTQERMLRQECPDILSFPGDSFHLNRPVYEDDFQWDSTPVGRWDTLAKTLPPIVTCGSIIVERGKPHFKGPPLVECPRCKSKLTHGTAKITFKHAPTATQQQEVEAWVCSCGEFYVPGEIARAAYLRAFQRSDSAAPGNEPSLPPDFSSSGGSENELAPFAALPESDASGFDKRETRFRQLAEQWRSETAHLSNIRKKALHSAYQEIIGMGEPVVPLILEEMKRSPGQWFWALHAITGADPVAEENRGKLREMTEAWLEWGRHHGFQV